MRRRLTALPGGFLGIYMIAAAVGWAARPSGAGQNGHCIRIIIQKAADLATVEKTGLIAEKKLRSGVLARATDAQLRKLYGRGISFEVMSEAYYNFMISATAVEKKVSPQPPVPACAGNVAILVDDAVYSSIVGRLSRYVSDVEAAYDDVTLSIHRNSWTDAEALRAYLQTLYANEGITGAILVGLLPYAMWEFPWGERCPLPFFFEDMDGTFSDTDGNGVYDYHGWGANDGPEIWIALMRPPENDVNALQGFLDKSHRVHSGALSVRPWAFVCINNDWRGAVDPIRAALTPLYGSNIDVVGGSTWRVSGQEYLSGLGNGYEITSLWAHSASWVHQFDQDPQQYVYYYDVTDLSPGSFFTAVWGCHAMDFNESPSTNFGIAYTFGASNGVAAVGATRSIGIENQEVIYSSLAAGKNLSEAYFDYLEYNYDSAFIQRTFPSDDTNKFVWDFVLYGDPFVFNPDVVAPMNLLRNDALTRIDPPSTPLSHIFTDACSSDPSVSLDSADPADCGSAINGEGGMVSSPGSGDNDDLYVSNFALPGSDPESNLLDDVTRPLMFWQLEHATPPNALRIIKTPAARTIGIDIR